MLIQGKTPPGHLGNSEESLGERRCITSTLDGNEAAGNGKQDTHVRSPVTPHNLPAAQEQSQRVDLNLKCHNERENLVRASEPHSQSHTLFTATAVLGRGQGKDQRRAKSEA